MASANGLSRFELSAFHCDNSEIRAKKLFGKHLKTYENGYKELLKGIIKLV